MRVRTSPAERRDEQDLPSEASLLRQLGWGKGAGRVWGLLRGNRLLSLGQILLSLLVGLSEAAILTIFARVALASVNAEADEVSVPVIGNSSITVTLLIVGVLILARLAVGLLAAATIGHLQFRIVTSLRSEVLGSYSAAWWRSQANLDEGGLQQLVVILPNSTSGSLSGLLKNFSDILTMVAMLAYAGLSDPALTLALIIAILAFSSTFIPFRRFVKSESARLIRGQMQLSSAITELSNMKVEVQAFGVNERVTRPIRNLIVDVGRLGRRLAVTKSMAVPLYTSMTYLAVAIGLVILQGASPSGVNEVGPILLVVLRSLGYGQAIQQGAVALAGIMPTLDVLQDQVESFDANRVEWGTKPLVSIESIELKGVSFTYSEADGIALNDACVAINRGERVGIVGPSGGGKSTLVRLLLGLVPADSGSVLVNRLPIHEYDRDMWGERIGFVPQSAEVLNGTVAENLRLFRDGITDEDLWWALDVADLTRDVRVMPDVLQTKIGVGERTLSGGQQQRLAIARAFATRPDLVVMDEPTSSIDTMSEAAVSGAIERLPDDVTVVIVSHRMRILRGCDRLIVVEGGRITASGAPEEVLASSSYFVASLEA